MKRYRIFILNFHNYLNPSLESKLKHLNSFHIDPKIKYKSCQRVSNSDKTDFFYPVNIYVL